MPLIPCDCNGGRTLFDWHSIGDLFDVPRDAYEDEWGVWWVPCSDCNGTCQQVDSDNELTMVAL